MHTRTVITYAPAYPLPFERIAPRLSLCTACIADGIDSVDGRPIGPVYPSVQPNPLINRLKVQFSPQTTPGFLIHAGHNFNLS